MILASNMIQLEDSDRVTCGQLVIIVVFGGIVGVLMVSYSIDVQMFRRHECTLLLVDVAGRGVLVFVSVLWCVFLPLPLCVF
jgi:hypothetical protein